MPALTSSRLKALHFSLVALLLAARAFAQVNLGSNPTVAANTSLTLNAADFFTGTLTVGSSGQSGGLLFLATDYSTGLSLSFTGSNSQLTHPNSLHTLTLTSTAAFLRTGTGVTSLQENIDNSGAFTVNGGTLFSNSAFTNEAGGAVTVTGAGSILNLTSIANLGSLVADTSGQLHFTGNLTTANLGSITLTNGGIAELASGSTLTNTAANLTAPVGGAYLFNGTIVGGTITANALTQSGGTLDGASITGSFTVPTNTSLTLKNGGTWSGGTATIGTAGQSGGLLFLNTDSTVTAGLTFTGSNSQLTHPNSLHTLTLTSTAAFTRTGTGVTSLQENIDNSGSFTVNGGTLFSNSAFTNEAGGTVTATGAGSILNLASIANLGSLVADASGQLRFTGNLTTANLGSITLTNGGIAELASGSTLTNTAANLTAPVGGAYLFNGTIVGGTIATNALTQSGGTLDGASITGSFTVPTNTSLTLKNGGTWSGGTATIGTAGQSGGLLFLNTDSTVTAGLTFTGSNSQLTHPNSLHTLTLTSTAAFIRTGTGVTSLQENIDNSGAFTVNGGTLFSNSAFTNEAGGTVTVTGAGSILNLTSIANLGSLAADTGGQLRFTGNLTTANLGSITLTNGGIAELASGSILTNNGAVTNLTAPAGGAYLFNGTVVGGTIAANALTQSGGTLDGASITGSVAIPNGTSLTLKNNGGWTGTATVGVSGQSGGLLFLATDDTLASALVYTGSNSQLTHSSSPKILTLTSTSSLTRTGVGTTSAFENLVNNGTVAVNGGTLFSSGTLTNQSGGNVTVSNGATLSQTGAFTNNAGATASVTGAGSKLALANPANSGSLVSDTAALLSLTGNFTTANLGSITLTNGGTVELATGSILTNNGAVTNLVAPTGGSYIFNGTILGGTIANNALTQSAGTLDGASITGSVAVPNGTSLTLKNNGGWTGTATVGIAGQNGGLLFLATDDTLSTGLVFAGSNSQLTHSSSAKILTLTSTGSLTRTGVGTTSAFENLVNNGTVAVNGGTLFSSGTLTNQSGGNVTVSNGATLSQTGTFTNNAGATASVTGAGSTLAVANVANSGSLASDTNGLLSLTGAFTTAGLGSITLTNGGSVELATNSTLTNSAATLTAPTGGSYIFKGTIVGGTIANNALTQNAGTLDAASITGSVAIPNGTSLTLKNNGGWTGTATVGFAGQNGGLLFLATDDTLSTGLVFAGSNSQLTHSSSAKILTLTSTGSLTRTGAGTTSAFENLVNNGTVAVNGGTLFSSGTLTNQSGGNVTVSNGATFSQTGAFTNNNGATAAVSGLGSVLALANLANAGALTSDTSGLLSLTGAFTTAGLGSITLTNGGAVELATNSTLTNTAANLLPPTGGAYNFKGTIIGGTIDPLALTEISGTLDGATITGSLAVPNGTSLTLKNNGSWTGTATVGAAGQNGGLLFLATDDTLSSGLVFAGSNSQLTHSSSAKILTLTSTGSLARTGAGTTSSFENVVNNGSVAVTGGTFFSSGTFTNQAGGSVNVASGATFSQSTNAFTQTGGALKVDGTFNTGSSGLTVSGGSVSGMGAIAGNTTFTGGLLDPGSPTGTLTFAGNLTLGAGVTTLMELNNGTSDKLAGIGTLTFGGQLNIVPLTAAFTAGQQWNLFSFTTSSGSFSNISLPYTAQGWVWDTSQLQTSGLLTLTTVVPIPEPSTYLLVVTGLGLMLALRRRRTR